MLDNPGTMVTGSCELPTASALVWRAILPVPPPFYFFKLHLLILSLSLSVSMCVGHGCVCVCVCVVNMYVRYVCDIHVCTCLAYTCISTCIDTDVHACMRKLKFSIRFHFILNIGSLSEPGDRQFGKTSWAARFRDPHARHPGTRSTGLPPHQQS